MAMTTNAVSFGHAATGAMGGGGGGDDTGHSNEPGRGHQKETPEICEQCGRKGHAKADCRASLCNKCNGWHMGICKPFVCDNCGRRFISAADHKSKNCSAGPSFFEVKDGKVTKLNRNRTRRAQASSVKKGYHYAGTVNVLNLHDGLTTAEVMAAIREFQNNRQEKNRSGSAIDTNKEGSGRGPKGRKDGGPNGSGVNATKQ